MDDYKAPLGDNLLASIAATARQIVAARAHVADCESALSEAKNRLRVLEEETLPELMHDAGQTQLTTIDGLLITVKDVFRGTPTKDNELKAYKWLEDNGQAGLIKSTVTADIPKGQLNLMQRVVEAVAEQGAVPVYKKSVHWQSLGAAVKELLEKGQDVPLDLLGVSVITRAEVKIK